MYTVVLMAALTTTPPAQAWHRAHGWHSGHGCGGFASCYAAGNNGWNGGGYWGCYGCFGYGHPWGAASWMSGSYGDGVFAPGPYGAYGAPFVCHGCSGAHGGCSCWGYPHQQALTQPAPPVMPVVPVVPERKTEGKPGKAVEEAPLPKAPGLKNGEQARAKVIVDLPADANLFVDGQRMNGTASRRIFQTPQLIPGQTYYYELRAEVIRDGQIIVANQRVILRPGENATASFAELGKSRDATARANGQ